MSQPRPLFYDDLDLTLAEAFALWSRGVKDRRSAFHTPTLATIGRDGRPRARIVVLRAFAPSQRLLRVHTDARSDKADEIAAEARVALLGYDAAAKIQIRLEGRARLHRDDAIADAAWAASRPQSRACYGTAPAPGTAIGEGGGFALPAEGDDAALAAGRAHFTAIEIRFSRLEWLYLAQSGHRRALFRWEEAGADESRPQAGWLAP